MENTRCCQINIAGCSGDDKVTQNKWMEAPLKISCGEYLMNVIYRECKDKKEKKTKTHHRKANQLVNCP